MVTPESVLEEVIEELATIQGKPQCALVEPGEFPIPSMLPVGDEGGLYTTKKMERAIGTLARMLKMKDASLAARFTDDEWRNVVRNSLGPRLAQIDLDEPAGQNAADVLSEMRRVLAAAATATPAREHVLPCTLFNAQIKAFTIGPLTIESRDSWLDRQAAAGALKPKVADRIRRAWSGGKLRARRRGFEAIQEKALMQMVGGSEFICSLTTHDYAPSAAGEKALLIARVGLTMIALLWQVPSRTLDGVYLRYDREVRSVSTLSFASGVIGIPGVKLSSLPHGAHLKAGEWEHILKSQADYFRQCGEVLDFLLNVDGNVTRPNIMNTLAQSLIWFHQGCREPNGLMAIVNFAAALDALASGTKAQGIRKLISARLQMQDTTQLTPHGPTMKRAVDTIYSEGRSRAIHGTSDKISHDWSVTRGIAEQLARFCLLASIDWAIQNATSDEPDRLRT